MRFLTNWLWYRIQNSEVYSAYYNLCLWIILEFLDSYVSENIFFVRSKTLKLLKNILTRLDSWITDSDIALEIHRYIQHNITCL